MNTTISDGRRQRMSIEQRFWGKVSRSDGCWLWLGAKTNGYGVMRMGDRNVLAHRYSYEVSIAPIPDGLQIDHLCRNRACVNPCHLDVVTNKENCLCGESANAENARKTECKRGHPFNEDNTYLKPDNGQRQCRICRHDARIVYHERTGK